MRRYAVTEYFLENLVEVLAGRADKCIENSVKNCARGYLKACKNDKRKYVTYYNKE